MKLLHTSTWLALGMVASIMVATLPVQAGEEWPGQYQYNQHGAAAIWLYGYDESTDEWVPCGVAPIAAYVNIEASSFEIDTDLYRMMNLVVLPGDNLAWSGAELPPVRNDVVCMDMPRFAQLFDYHRGHHVECAEDDAGERHRDVLCEAHVYNPAETSSSMWVRWQYMADTVPGFSDTFMALEGTFGYQDTGGEIPYRLEGTFLIQEPLAAPTVSWRTY